MENSGLQKKEILYIKTRENKLKIKTGFLLGGEEGNLIN